MTQRQLLQQSDQLRLLVSQLDLHGFGGCRRPAVTVTMSMTSNMIETVIVYLAISRANIPIWKARLRWSLLWAVSLRTVQRKAQWVRVRLAV